ncbi:MAG: SGNH/GDSL hydrolase family protein [Planctomycetota bacterium]
MSKRENNRTEKWSPSRLRLFRLGAVILGLMPLVIAEGICRLLARAPQPLEYDPIFDTTEVRPLFQTTGEFREVRSTRLEFFRPDRFLTEKPENGRRVFVLGGSTVQGRPYEIETAFSTWLRLRLQAADPNHVYEVVNCGGVSYASYRLAIVLREILEYQPDAVVLYTGHNEFLEQRSYQTWKPRRPLVDGVVRRSRLLQVLAKSFQRAPDQTLTAEVQTRLDEPDGLGLYRRDEPWRAAVVEHFERNLSAMIMACDRANVPLLLCRPVSEIVETAPFKVASLQWAADEQPLFESAWRLALDPQRRVVERIAACESCLEMDAGHAGAHFVAGRLHLIQGRAGKAREHLIAARDHDVCPLRATGGILDRIDALAAQTGTPLIHLDQPFDESNLSGQSLPDGFPDPAKFVDHIHPTIAMHQEIATRVGRRLMRLWNVKLGRQAEADYHSAVQSHLESLDETYHARAKQRLAGLLQWAAGRAGELHLGEEPSVTSSRPE